MSRTNQESPSKMGIKESTHTQKHLDLEKSNAQDSSSIPLPYFSVFNLANLHRINSSLIRMCDVVPCLVNLGWGNYWARTFA